MNTILYFHSPSKTSSSAEKLIGIREIAAKLHWHVQAVDGGTTKDRLRRLLDFWKPLGVIVECGERDEVPDDFGILPVVYIDRDPGKLMRSSRRFFVLHDSFVAGQTAARELMMTGCSNFAFVPFPGHWSWSAERQRGFVDALDLNGYACRVFRSRTTDLDSPAYVHELRQFLRKLPTPCAVFVANDHPAERVIAEAAFLGLSIPDELSVLGVDDYAPICEHTAPPLSSVKPDFRRGGNLAALLLAAAIRDKSRFRGPRIRRYGTLQVVRRDSTRIFSRKGDCPEVAEALKLIRNRACDGLTAEEVMATFSCSRTTAAAKFRTATGHSILDEIHAVQLDRVKAMLSDRDRQLKTISDFCGFKNPNSLRKFFLRETGLTMSAWRRQRQ